MKNTRRAVVMGVMVVVGYANTSWGALEPCAGGCCSFSHLVSPVAQSAISPAPTGAATSPSSGRTGVAAATTAGAFVGGAKAAVTTAFGNYFIGMGSEASRRLLKSPAALKFADFCCEQPGTVCVGGMASVALLFVFKKEVAEVSFLKPVVPGAKFAAQSLLGGAGYALASRALDWALKVSKPHVSRAYAYAQMRVKAYLGNKIEESSSGKNEPLTAKKSPTCTNGCKGCAVSS